MKALSVYMLSLALAIPFSASAKTSQNSGHMASKSYVGIPAAKRAALHAVPGHALSAKLENEDGKMQYAVMIKDSKSMHEVMVDAHTGKVASQERVTAAEEARENAAESKAARAKHMGASKTPAHKG